MCDVNQLDMDKKRVICGDCGRPLRACICGLVKPVKSRVKLGILQHPQEARQAKGTAQLAQKCLDCEIWLGEKVADLPALQLWLSQRPTYLLYPADECSSLVVSSEQMAEQLDDVQFLVVDGTWRKTHKIVQLNPMLAALPRISLMPTSPSSYAIRKVPNEQSLSTLEAIYSLLCQVDADNAQTYLPLKQAFDEFIAQRLAFVPSTRPGA